MKSISQAQSNLEASLGTIGTRYSAGLNGVDWATPASSDAAEQLWATNVASAAARKARQTGIRAAGNQKWLQNSQSKGATNIAAGVRAGLAKYGTNFGPILSAMQAAAQSAKPRTSDPLANIQNRLVPVVLAARAAAGKK